MEYKAYPNKVTVRQRMARKRLRRDIFLANRKMAHVRRKAARLKRQSLEDSE